ncbi:hypothetical protein ACFC0M_16500 [Streptomyces sp. NPDC056149]|uniref:hypothetical protein n=1 Tax=unclassified Streptomyces TaxID=2593676 RepID=UPI00238180B6|nr:hypothetical protein [Streptomyces sp. WZ-12]
MSNAALLSLDLDGIEAADFEVVEASEFSSAAVPAIGSLPGVTDGGLEVRMDDNGHGNCCCCCCPCCCT